ncbi:hypothetical protein [Erythrobacter sp.]|jgi:hypothetical protein|uniref:hypothetical protein n=1 Tax=Erythrobacter sp. TaxID=1042 RepID=UPI002EC054CA|nr:hypothetical protein [Erythrobacter sp.]
MSVSFRPTNASALEEVRTRVRAARLIEVINLTSINSHVVMHVNELTMAMHRAGTDDERIFLKITCGRPPLEDFASHAGLPSSPPRPGVLARLSEGTIARLHRHLVWSTALPLPILRMSRPRRFA